jgi:hypothetical protein
MYEPVVKKTMVIPLYVETDNITSTTQHDVDLVPHILATGLGIGQSRNKNLFKCLLDSGGTNPMINPKCIPPSINLDTCPSVKLASLHRSIESNFETFAYPSSL